MKMKSDIVEQFVTDVQRRCDKLNRSPKSVTIDAGLSHAAWDSWIEGGSSPSGNSMTRILKHLERLERDQ